MDQPEQFEGVITLAWPPANGAMLGGMVCPYRDGKLVTTMTGILVHCGAEELIWAECTMFAGKDGRPVYDGRPVVTGGEIIFGTFAFLVAGMSVREPSASGAHVAR